LVQPKQLDTHISTYLADLLTWAAHNGMEILPKPKNGTWPFGYH